MDMLRQGVTVPLWGESAALYYDWYMVSDESTLEAYDYLHVVLWDKELNHPILWSTKSNKDQRGMWFTSSSPVDGVDVADIRGHHVEISVYAWTDSSLPTLWYVDNVRLVFACGSVAP